MCTPLNWTFQKNCSGSNVAVHLVRKFPQVKFVVLDKLEYCASLHNLDEIKDCRNFIFIKVDMLLMHCEKLYQ